MLSGPLTPRFGLPNFAETDRPNLAVSPGIPDQLAAIDGAIRDRGALTVAAFGGANYGLPTAPVDGDIVTLIVDAANGVEWRLRYVAAEPTYKWRFQGGSALYSEVTPAETTVSTVYAALTTPGPSVVLPRPGDYDVELGCSSYNNANGALSLMSYAIGATAAVDADMVINEQGAGTNGAEISQHRKRRKSALGAVTLAAQYRVSIGSGAGSGTGVYERRYLAAVPVRIG